MPTWTTGARIVAIALALLIAPAASDAKTALEGAWMAVDAVLAGKPDEKLSSHILRIKDGTFQITKDGKLLFGGKVETNATPKPPTVDFHQTGTDSLAGIWLGIYALDRDSLTICDNAYDMKKPRPANFDDCHAEGYVTLRFTRIK